MSKRKQGNYCLQKSEKIVWLRRLDSLDPNHAQFPSLTYSHSLKKKKKRTLQ